MDQFGFIDQKTSCLWLLCLLHFVAFFHVASLFSTGVDNKKVGVDNEKALELTNSTVFHRGRQQKSSRAGQQNIFFLFSHFSIKYYLFFLKIYVWQYASFQACCLLQMSSSTHFSDPKMQQNILLHCLTFWLKLVFVA